MDIHTAAKYMSSGYRIKRAAWTTVDYIYDSSGRVMGSFSNACTKGEFSLSLSTSDLLADDWELITEGVSGHFPVTYEDKQ